MHASVIRDSTARFYCLKDRLSRLTDASRQYLDSTARCLLFEGIDCISTDRCIETVPRDSYCLKDRLSRLTDVNYCMVINISIYRGNNSSISRKYTKVFSNA